MRSRLVGSVVLVVVGVLAAGVFWLSRHQGVEPVASPEPGAAVETRRPNVLVIVWDTARADRFSVYGHDRPTTPRLEALARDSVVFERAYSPGIWTLPSHASLFTGLAPESTGADERWLWLDEQHVTLAEHFGRHGYDTFAFAANALLSTDTNLVQGFDVVLNTWRGKVRPLAAEATKNKLIPGDRSNELCPDWRPPAHGATNAEWARAVYKEAAPLIGEGLLRWLDQREGDEPWLAYLNMMEAHTPRIPSMEARRKVMDEELVARSLIVDQAHINLHFYNFGKFEYSERDLAAIRGVYDATLTELDAATGDLLDALEARGVLDDTIVVITSDHGENLGDHHLFNHRFALWDSLAHVPLIVRYPKSLTPARIARPVSTRSLFATLAALADLPPPASAHDTPSWFSDQASAPVTYLSVPLEREVRTVQEVYPDVVGAPWLRMGHAVHTDPFKLVRWSTGERELYDVILDPGETTDLMGGHPEVADRLTTTLDAHVAGTPPYDPSRRTERDEPRNVRASQEDLRNQLEALGYLQE